MKRAFSLTGKVVLRTAFFVAILGCGHNPNGPGSYQAVMQAQQSAEESVKSLGATLERKQYPLGSAWAINLSGKEISPKVFDALKRLGPIAELNLRDTNLSDDDMKQFGDTGFAGLFVDLDLGNTAVSDAGLKELKVSKFLMKLNLAGTKVTDSGVTQWQKDRAADTQIAQGFKKVKIAR